MIPCLQVGGQMEEKLAMKNTKFSSKNAQSSATSKTMQHLFKNLILSVIF